MYLKHKLKFLIFEQTRLSTCMHFRCGTHSTEFHDELSLEAELRPGANAVYVSCTSSHTCYECTTCDQLKLDLYDKNNVHKNLVSNQYTLFDSSRFSHSNFGSSPAKTYVHKRTLLEENKAHGGLNQQPLYNRSIDFPKELRRLIFRVVFQL